MHQSAIIAIVHQRTTASALCTRVPEHQHQQCAPRYHSISISTVHQGRRASASALCHSINISSVHQGTTASGHFFCISLQHFCPERSLTCGYVIHLDLSAKNWCICVTFLCRRTNITKVEQQVHVQHLSWEKLETEEQASQT